MDPKPWISDFILGKLKNKPSMLVEVGDTLNDDDKQEITPLEDCVAIAIIHDNDYSVVAMFKEQEKDSNSPYDSYDDEDPKDKLTRGAILILHEYRVQIVLNPSCYYFCLKVDRYAVLDQRVGILHTKKVQNCTRNPAVSYFAQELLKQERANGTIDFEEDDTDMSQNMTDNLSQLVACLSQASQGSHSWTTLDLDTIDLSALNWRQLRSRNSTRLSGVSSDGQRYCEIRKVPGKKNEYLKRLVTSVFGDGGEIESTNILHDERRAEELIISNQDQRILDETAEWKEGYIPPQPRSSSMEQTAASIVVLPSPVQTRSAAKGKSIIGKNILPKTSKNKTGSVQQVNSNKETKQFPAVGESPPKTPQRQTSPAKSPRWGRSPQSQIANRTRSRKMLDEHNINPCSVVIESPNSKKRKLLNEQQGIKVGDAKKSRVAEGSGILPTLSEKRLTRNRKFGGLNLEKSALHVSDERRVSDEHPAFHLDSTDSSEEVAKQKEQSKDSSKDTYSALLEEMGLASGEPHPSHANTSPAVQPMQSTQAMSQIGPLDLQLSPITAVRSQAQKPLGRAAQRRRHSSDTQEEARLSSILISPADNHEDTRLAAMTQDTGDTEISHGFIIPLYVPKSYEKPSELSVNRQIECGAQAKSKVVPSQQQSSGESLFTSSEEKTQDTSVEVIECTGALDDIQVIEITSSSEERHSQESRQAVGNSHEVIEISDNSDKRLTQEKPTRGSRRVGNKRRIERVESSSEENRMQDTPDFIAQQAIQASSQTSSVDIRGEEVALLSSIERFLAENNTEDSLPSHNVPDALLQRVTNYWETTET